MPDVKWIKITTEMFDDEKIKLIESMPDKDSILIIWIKLLVQAGKCNATGYIFLNETLPYTDEMLSTIFNRPLNTVRLALTTFQKFGMIDILDDGKISITNWEKHQNIEGMEKVKEQNRLRAQKYRKRLKIVGGYSYYEHYNEIFERDNGQCVYCGSRDDLCVDHLIPVSAGGDNEKDNLVIACKKCNAGKSGRLVEEAGYSFISQKTANLYIKTASRITSRDVTGQNKNKNKNKNKIKEIPANKFADDSIEIQLSKHLFSLIQDRNPKAKKPDFQKWAKHIDLMIRRDNRTEQEVRDAIDWCQNDDFWFSNILSTDNLRKKYDKLYAAAQREKICGQPKRYINNLKACQEFINE